MARHTDKNMVSAGALKSQKLAGIADATERLYWRLHMATDTYGTMQGQSWDVHFYCTSMVSGWSPEKVEVALKELVAVGLVVRWQEWGETWIHLIGYDEHQKSDYLRKRGQRKTPAPPQGSQGQTRADYSAPRATKSAPQIEREKERTPQTPQGASFDEVVGNISTVLAQHYPVGSDSIAHQIFSTAPLRNISTPALWAATEELVKAKEDGKHPHPSRLSGELLKRAKRLDTGGGAPTREQGIAMARSAGWAV